MTKPENVDAYLAGLPDVQRTTLEALRRQIRVIVPDAVEAISYGLPAFKYGGRVLVHFGAAKNHCAFYGLVPEELKEDLAGYDTSKGTIRFPADQPPPEAVVRKLLAVRVAGIDAAVSRKRDKAGESRLKH